MDDAKQRKEIKEITPLIFKMGDDLRRDILILQILNIMDNLWIKEVNLDLHLSIYSCISSINHTVGFIEVVPNAKTIASIQKQEGGVLTGALKTSSLAKWLFGSLDDKSNSSNSSNPNFELNKASQNSFYFILFNYLFIFYAYSKNIGL